MLDSLGPAAKVIAALLAETQHAASRVIEREQIDSILTEFDGR